MYGENPVILALEKAEREEFCEFWASLVYGVSTFWASLSCRIRPPRVLNSKTPNKTINSENIIH